MTKTKTVKAAIERWRTAEVELDRLARAASRSDASRATKERFRAADVEMLRAYRNLRRALGVAGARQVVMSGA